MAVSLPGDPLPHDPVLYHEIILALQPRDGGFYIDGTVGAGGHSWGLLNESSPGGRLLGLDLDPQALELAAKRLQEFSARAEFVKASYTSIPEQVDRLGWGGADGILLDLGISSMQVDTASRGFSFMVDAPLDMRFDPSGTVTAGDLVNDLPEKDLADLIYRYGEEHRARRIAKAIVQARPLHSTKELAAVINRAVGGSRGTAGRSSRIDPATLTFQALRIAVNQELQSIELALPRAVQVLNPGGRLAVISFHSLEDRLVKQFMRRESQDCICPPRQPVCTCGHRASIREFKRRPIVPGEEEVEKNPRSRSARLRIAEKL
jgi:16S rRNA (cytosine1402-N4)-methyltransferase